MNGTKAILLGLVCAAVLHSACSRSNNLLLGRVEATVGTHTVVVTDCYRTSVPQPQRVTDAPGGPPYDRFTPCRDADIVIRDEALVVNGKSYGRLSQGDAVTVDHGKVLINDREAREIASAQDDSPRSW
jgi:hypothetical protein